jgi:threonyl-tRNA synthetase
MPAWSPNGQSLAFVTWNDTDGKSTMWHSSAHLMAEALEFHFPGVKLAIGPPVNSGFYYDVDFMDYSISEKDLEKIEQKMKELAKAIPILPQPMIAIFILLILK